MPIRNPYWRTGALILCLSGVLCLACSSNAKPSLYPVRGTVTVRGKPAVKAIVVLRPVATGSLKEQIPHGEVGPDGTFRIGTFADADGAPAGAYTVTITWPETRRDEKTRDEVSVDRLQGQYADPAKSKWQIAIQEGDNQLEPFRLD